MTKILIQWAAIVFSHTLSFFFGCIGCKFLFLGANCGSVGATPSFRFAICCFAHVCPVSGFRLGWDISSTEALKPERGATRGLCGQNEHA